MKLLIILALASSIAEPSSAIHCRKFTDEIATHLKAVNRADLALVALGETFSGKKIPKAQRVEVMAAVERVLAWSHSATDILGLVEMSGCGDALGATSLRAAVEDVSRDAERVRARLKK